MISTIEPWYIAETVPKSMPVSHTVSAISSRIPLTASGRASVVKSRSWDRRPSSASRTEPPTRYRRYPAAPKAPARLRSVLSVVASSFTAAQAVASICAAVLSLLVTPRILQSAPDSV